MMVRMKVYFAGFGPGDKDLLTLKAYRLLKEADIIIYPGSLIDEDLLSEFKAEKVNSHGMKLEEIIELIENAVKNGKKVVRLQSGDPSIYGAIAEQTRELEKKGIEYEIIPGVSSVFAASAALKTELTMPDVAEFVFVGRPKGRTLDDDYLDVVASLPCTIIILLGVDKMRYVAEKVAEVRGKDEPVAVVYHASREDEKIITGTLADIADKVEAEGIKRTAVIIIGKALKKEGRRSLLYG